MWKKKHSKYKYSSTFRLNLIVPFLLIAWWNFFLLITTFAVLRQLFGERFAGANHDHDICITNEHEMQL